MSANENNRETGARKYPAKTDTDASDQISQDAAQNRKPAGGMGLAEPMDHVNEKTRHADGRRPAQKTSSPAAEKVAGAGPAIAEPSKDAKAPKGGSQPGAYVKD